MEFTIYKDNVSPYMLIISCTDDELITGAAKRDHFYYISGPLYAQVDHLDNIRMLLNRNNQY